MPPQKSNDSAVQQAIDDMDVCGHNADLDMGVDAQEKASRKEKFLVPDLFGKSPASPRTVTVVCDICLHLDKQLTQARNNCLVDGPHYMEMRTKFWQHVCEHEENAESLLPELATADAVVTLLTVPNQTLQPQEENADQDQDFADLFDWAAYDKDHVQGQIDAQVSLEMDAMPARSSVSATRRPLETPESLSTADLIRSAEAHARRATARILEERELAAQARGRSA